MKTVRRVLHREVFFSIVLVSLAFLGLFLFFDLLEELPNVGKQRAGVEYSLFKAASYVLLFAPTRLYELLPISVLIGTILALARLAQSSEFTILRVSGLSPTHCLRGLLGLGVFFVGLTFVLGDYVAPKGVQMAQNIHGSLASGRVVGKSGAWLREKRDGGNQFIVNVKEMPASNVLRGITIVETSADGQLRSKTVAASGTLITNDDLTTWQLRDVVRTTVQERPIENHKQTEVVGNTSVESSQENQAQKTKSEEAKGEKPQDNASEQANVLREHSLDFAWQTGLTVEKVITAMQRPERMSAVSLWQYAQHLQSNGQDAQLYEIGFWRKVFYPLSCLVMVVLGLPFAYLHFRSGTISSYVFIGVLVGISFFLLNNIFGHIGNLNNWRPWLAAAMPSMVYSVIAMTVFTWLVRNR